MLGPHFKRLLRVSPGKVGIGCERMAVGGVDQLFESQ